MKNQINLLLRQSIFWLLVFTVNRIIFLFYYSNLLISDDIQLTEILQIFVHAFKLDISTLGYILTFPFILNLFSFAKSSVIIKQINRIYSILVLLIYQLISLGELQLYGEWKTKLSAKAVTYLKEPTEVIGSATNSGIVISVVLLVILLAIFVFVYNKLVFKIELKPFKFLKIINVSYILIMSFGLFYGMRGGLQAIPITASQAYFSKHDILNITAVNSAYYMMFSIMDYQSINSQNIFKTIDEKHALNLVKQMHEIEKDTTISILNNSRPNIVILLLESWSGDMIESLGGDAGFTPEFRKLENEGILFTEFYATANRSQQAMASIYSGLPGLPVTTLTNHPEKYPSVPSLVKILNSEGYFSSFTFGGKLIYGNMKSYLSDNRFDLIVEQDDIKANGPLGKLGFHDEFMFDYFETQISEMQQPFFANLFSLSSHSPYDFPGDRKFDNINLEQDFVNSIYYSDEQLGKFFEKAKSSDYWENTLFIVLADHSHNSNKNHAVQSFEYHKIPLLITGGALKEEFRGTQNSKLCSNVDVTTTLLHQLKINSDDFFWSKDIFNPYSPEFAYFELNSGFGWKRNYGEQVMSIKDNYYYLRKVSNDNKEKLDQEGKAYLQVLFDEFMGY